MKINFEDNSYIEFVASQNVGKIVIAIGAKSADKPNDTIINSIEITSEQLKSLLGSLKIVKTSRVEQEK